MGYCFLSYQSDIQAEIVMECISMLLSVIFEAKTVSKAFLKSNSASESKSSSMLVLVAQF